MPTVWLSRPAPRVVPLTRQLEAAGIRALVHPAMQIAAPADSKAIERYLQQVEIFAASIFVSAEAARRLAERLPAGAPLPALAIGNKTAAALSPRYRLLMPADTVNDSEHLLNSPLLQKPLGEIAIIGGSDGNNTPPSPALLQTLRERGNSVTAVSCYRRLPATDGAALATARGAGGIDAAVAYSSDSLRYMLQMTAPDNDWLRALPLFVIHANIADTARQLGFQEVIVAGDDNIIRMLRQRLIVG